MQMSANRKISSLCFLPSQLKLEALLMTIYVAYNKVEDSVLEEKSRCAHVRVKFVACMCVHLYVNL